MNIDVLRIESTGRKGNRLASSWRARWGDRDADLNQLPFEEPTLDRLLLPDNPRPLKIEIEVRPKSDKFWPVRALFLYSGAGVLKQLHSGKPYPDGSDRVAEFGLAQSVGFQKRARVLTQRLSVSLFVITLPVQLSPIRDVTDEVVAMLDAGIDPKMTAARYASDQLHMIPKGDPRRTSWNPPRMTILQIAMAGQKLDASSPTLNVAERTVDPSKRMNRILQIAGARGPRFLSMSWPRSLTPASDPKPTPFVLLFRAPFGTNAQFYNASNDLKWDLHFYSIWQWSHCQFDPLIGKPPKNLGGPDPKGAFSTATYRMGAPYQVEASGKDVVLLLPKGTFGESLEDEYVDFLDADFLRDILLEVQAHVCRQFEVVGSPQRVGRIAMGTFSFANKFLHKFLTKPSNAGFCRSELREVYMFDPPVGNHVQQQLIPVVTTWATTATRSADDVPHVRLYTQSALEAHDTLLGAPVKDLNRRNPAPFGSYFLPRDLRDYAPVTPPLYKVTVARVTAETVIATRKKSGGGPLPAGNDPTHPMFPGLFLKDALERSGF